MNQIYLKKFVKLSTQNFLYYLASFIFSSFCVHPVFVTKVLLPLNTFKTEKIFPSVTFFFHYLLVLGCSTCIFFTENFTMPSSAIGSTTYQILFSSVKQFLSYSANRQTQFFSINYCFQVVQPVYFSLKIVPFFLNNRVNYIPNIMYLRYIFFKLQRQQTDRRIDRQTDGRTDRQTD